LYYSFENKPTWYRAIWKLSDYVRKFVSSSPKTIKNLLLALIAYSVYFPLVKSALLLDKLGLNVNNFPLSVYRNKPFYHCKNDALDRFGTRLEQRFSKSEITEMLRNAGCENIEFSPSTPFWCCVAFKK